MNKIAIQIRRKQASFLFFYKHIIGFSLLVSVWIFIGDSMLGFIRPDATTPFGIILYLIQWLSFRLATFSFIGALGLTHSVLKKEYYYFRNQGFSIKSLILFSWMANCLAALVLLVFSYSAGAYV